MTRIDFYILPATEPEDRFQFACRLVDKAAQNGHSIYIHTRNEADSKQLDDQLWQFRADSFIPHSLVSEQSNGRIEIGHDADPAHHHDVLINLAHEVPLFFSRFQRVSEIVVQEEDVVRATRKHYAFYKERGYPLHNHDMRK